MTTNAIHPPTTDLGLPIGPCAAVDPSDQHDAASSRAVGSDGILAGQLQKASHVDLAQAASAVAGPDGGRCAGRGHAGPAEDARSMASDLWWPRYASLCGSRRQLFHVRSG